MNLGFTSAAVRGIAHGPAKRPCLGQRRIAVHALRIDAVPVAQEAAHGCARVKRRSRFCVASIEDDLTRGQRPRLEETVAAVQRVLFADSPGNLLIADLMQAAVGLRAHEHPSQPSGPSPSPDAG